ncbi:hypothetical protein ACYFX5_09160 [Bremerella sp. T1]|uniref:hypothetical protein n=1 Tax=Bremerella sp. TYQ1 TaxID=3119568 RepID=UPI001CD03FD3|nr:hypothetical protein [Bremerella volcania]UBM38421.1 hypothetical protein LA756_11095 [Bremerella volcania]
MGFFDDAIAWARGQIHDAAPSFIVYQTDSDSLALKATKGASEFQAEAGDDFAAEDHTIDFLIDPTKLVAAGTPFKPKAGHEIHELDGEGGNLVAKYRVTALPGVPPWTWSGQSRAMMRIHSRQIGDE